MFLFVCLFACFFFFLVFLLFFFFWGGGLHVSLYPLILVKSLHCIWSSCTRRFIWYGYPISNELQGHHLRIGHRNISPGNHHAGQHDLLFQRPTTTQYQAPVTNEATVKIIPNFIPHWATAIRCGWRRPPPVVRLWYGPTVRWREDMAAPIGCMPGAF